MTKYWVTWTEELILNCPIEAESESEAIEIAKKGIDLDVDSEPSSKPPKNYKATEL